MQFRRERIENEFNHHHHCCRVRCRWHGVCYSGGSCLRRHVKTWFMSLSFSLCYCYPRLRLWVRVRRIVYWLSAWCHRRRRFQEGRVFFLVRSLVVRSSELLKIAAVTRKSLRCRWVSNGKRHFDHDRGFLHFNFYWNRIEVMPCYFAPAEGFP